MSNINDNKSNRLELSGYIDGSLNDRWVEYLKVSTGWESGDSQQLNDLVGVWLEQQGAIGDSLPDMWHDYLITNGYDITLHRADMTYDFWSSTEVLP